MAVTALRELRRRGGTHGVLRRISGEWGGFQAGGDSLQGCEDDAVVAMGTQG